MAAGEYNLRIEQGATLHLLLTWNNPAGTPVNLTGYSARAMVRGEYSDTAELLEMTDVDYITLGGVAGTIEIIVPDTITEALDFDSGVWDLELESGSGLVTRLLMGAAYLSKEATK